MFSLGDNIYRFIRTNVSKVFDFKMFSLNTNVLKELIHNISILMLTDPKTCTPGNGSHVEGDVSNIPLTSCSVLGN